MPNTREKLIELLDVGATIANNICGGIACDDCEGYKYGCTFVYIADHLIANGVTFADDRPRFFINRDQKCIGELTQIIGSGPVILHVGEESIIPIHPGRWIPVTERLPDKECRCLVCTKGEYGSGVDIAGYCIEPTPKGIFYEDEMDSGFVIDMRTTHGVCVAINEIVTHWMPLPEPPAGVEPLSQDYFPAPNPEGVKNFTNKLKSFYDPEVLKNYKA